MGLVSEEDTNSTFSHFLVRGKTQAEVNSFCLAVKREFTFVKGEM